MSIHIRCICILCDYVHIYIYVNQNPAKLICCPTYTWQRIDPISLCVAGKVQKQTTWRWTTHWDSPCALPISKKNSNRYIPIKFSLVKISILVLNIGKPNTLVQKPTLAHHTEYEAFLQAPFDARCTDGTDISFWATGVYLDSAEYLGVKSKPDELLKLKPKTSDFFFAS